MTPQLTRADLLRRAAVGGARAFRARPATRRSPRPRTRSSARRSRSRTGRSTSTSNEKTKSRPTIDQFQRRYGVKVKYIEDINDNASFFGKIQAQLARGQSTGRDIIVMTDNSPYPALLIRRAGSRSSTRASCRTSRTSRTRSSTPRWDPNRTYSLPWQSGMTGIGYNATKTKPITTVDQLFTDKRLHGKVTLLTEMADSMGLVMLANGDDPGKVTDASFNRALQKIQKAVKSGQIRQFTGNDYSGLMAKGDVWAAFVWSGDMVQLHADNKSLRFNLPKPGGMIWTDNMLIPKKGDATTASAFMNFVYDPKIAAQIEDYVNYICPVKGADTVLLKTDPAVAKDPLIFPTKAMLAKLHQFDPKALFNPDYKTKWQKVLGG